MNMMLLGWSMQQWAYVSSWYERTIAPLPEPRLEGALAVKLAWEERYAHEPLSSALYMQSAAPMAFGWAKDTMLHAASECGTYGWGR